MGHCMIRRPWVNFVEAIPSGDLLVTRQANSSPEIYQPIDFMARPERFELPTTWFEVRVRLGHALLINNLRQAPVANLQDNAQ